MTSYTVTASNSGGNGINLQVEVLTGAAETGGAAAHTANTGVSTVSITPSFSSSYIAWAAQNGQTATAFTAAANNAMLANVQDATDGFSAGPGHYTGTVTSGTPVTAGASTPSGLGAN